MHETNETTGERVHRLRLMCGLSQVELADRTGTTSGTISKIETGRATASPDDLGTLARVLDCTQAFLESGASLAPTTRPWLRAYADAPQRSVDQQLAHCTSTAEVIETLGLRRIPDALPAFDSDLDDDHAIESFALHVRAAAQLDEASVVGNCIRATERVGCVVLPMSTELGKHLGLSTRANLVPILCVSKPSIDPDHQIPGDRQRFTVAHELGHLALHGHLAPPQTADEARRIEKQANLFAGAFLAPGDAILEDLHSHGGRVTLKTLVGMKERWGFAVKAFVTRFHQMGVIDPDQARSLYKQISSRGWNKAEPVEVGNESAVWLTKALQQWSNGAADPLAAASTAVGIGRSYLERWTDWSPTGLPHQSTELVDLDSRRTSRHTPPPDMPGTVSILSAHRKDA